MQGEAKKTANNHPLGEESRRLFENPSKSAKWPYFGKDYRALQKYFLNLQKSACIIARNAI